MSISAAKRIDLLNIVLLLLSFVVATVIPFELFLFVYAVLGPLHYLTEISWLHDKNYFTTGKQDVLILVLIATLIAVGVYKNDIGLAEWEITDIHVSRLIFISLCASFFFAFFKHNYLKWGGVFLVVLFATVADNLILFFLIFLPTLIHVFVFTFFFMLLGALRSRSAFGYMTVALHLFIPIILYFLMQRIPTAGITQYARGAYSDFAMLNEVVLRLTHTGLKQADVYQMIYSSADGIALMRFIAFAYTYHYLNWFSKTRIIGWHKVHKNRVIAILVLWIISVMLYTIDYELGFKWLFLLSFLHVILEFPLNLISLNNIIKEFKSRLIQ